MPKTTENEGHSSAAFLNQTFTGEPPSPPWATRKEAKEAAMRDNNYIKAMQHRIGNSNYFTEEYKEVVALSNTAQQREWQDGEDVVSKLCSTEGRTAQ